ncbi:exosortase F system-associated membrane protein [Pseudofulvibacter geojedonensis]|uniref:Exosortase F system-associated protein n=1 Tax=Pseudofulvibacter geojedonensis TaxID=1123758 RepID=A0ABW3I3G8_9FLAO
MQFRKKNILAIAILLLILVSIRLFEKKLFYDPFLQFFKLDYLSQDPPKYSFTKLIFSTIFRYIINSTVSIFILTLLFGRKVLRFSVLFFVVISLILLTAYILILFDLDRDWYLSFFYVRRFLIQPLFLLLLVPAFYYQEFLKKD